MAIKMLGHWDEFCMGDFDSTTSGFLQILPFPTPLTIN